MSDENLSIEKPETAKLYRWLLRNSKGEASITMTMTVVSFVLVAVLYVLNAFESLGPVKLRPFDVNSTSVFFLPVLASYVGRRYTDKDK